MSRRFILLGLLACSATRATNPDVEDASVEEGFVVPIEAGYEPCALVATPNRPSCADCLQRNCCITVNTCFADPRCKAVDDCMRDCEQRFGRPDAADCVRACGNADLEASQKILDMVDCQFERCPLACP
jgi:hypothetical protein